MLYDFLGDKELCVCNFGFKQCVNYPYFKGLNKSYTDHVLIPRYLLHSIVSCKIIDACPYNTSDHLPVKTCLVLSIPDSALSEITNVDNHDTMKVFPKVNSSDPEQLEAYTKHIKHTTSALSLVHLNDVKCRMDATQVLNNLCSVLSDIMHSCSSVVLKSCSRPSTYQGKCT